MFVSVYAWDALKFGNCALLFIIVLWFHKSLFQQKYYMSFTDEKSIYFIERKFYFCRKRVGILGMVF